MRFMPLVIIGLLLGGCSAHGLSTRRESSAAKERVAGMKSAMEWQSAQQQLLAGDTEKALKSIDRSLQLNPNVAKSHVLKGRILMEQGDLEGALNWFATAEGLDPENVEAQYYAGVVYERLKKPEDALRCYRHAAALDPSNPQYVVAAAEMLIDMGKLDEAEEELGSHRASFAHNAGVNQAYGHIAKLRGKYEEALAYYEEARLAAPDDPAILNDLVSAQVACKKYADAEINIGKLLTRKDYEGRRDLKLERAKCLVELDRPAEARDVLVKLTATDDGAADVGAWIALGKVSFKLKDTTRARTAAARLVAIAPDRPEGYQLRAMIFRRLGALDQAEENARKAVAIAPNAENYVLLGLIERQLGHAPAAGASFAKALEIDPKNPLAIAQVEEMRGTNAVAGVDPKE